MFVYIVVTLVALAAFLYLLCWIVTFCMSRQQRSYDAAMFLWDVEYDEESFHRADRIIVFWRKLAKWRRRFLRLMSMLIPLGSALAFFAYCEYEGYAASIFVMVFLSLLLFAFGIVTVFVLRKAVPRACLRRWSDGGEFQEKEMDNA